MKDNDEPEKKTLTVHTLAPLLLFVKVCLTDSAAVFVLQWPVLKHSSDV